MHQSDDTRVTKPSYTGVTVKHNNQKLIIEIPPALSWSKYSNLTKIFIVYYCIIFIDIIFFVFSTYWWGYLLGLCLFIEIIINGRLNTYYYILMLIIYLSYLIIFFANFELFNLFFLSLSIIILDSIFFPMLRRKLIRDIFFKTRIKISCSQLSIKRYIYNQCQLNFKHKLYNLPLKYYQTLMDKKILFRFIFPYTKYTYLPKLQTFIKTSNASDIIIHEGSNYKFGGFLSLQEKKWIYSEMTLYFSKILN